jgi:hypothetical protein
MTCSPLSLNDSCISSRTILVSTVLQLLGEQLDKLSRSSFFGDELTDYIRVLCDTVTDLQRDLDPDDEIALEATIKLVDGIWHATQFLTGTTSNRVPYEVTYLLREVLLDWKLDDSIVTTSLIQSPDFYCAHVERAPNIPFSARGKSYAGLNRHLVQIGVPEIFQHMPLFCAPLYHELAHYVDQRTDLIIRMLTFKEAEVGAALPAARQFSKGLSSEVILSHFTEHFCDLFAACYVGECVSDYVSQWSQDMRPPSDTHPYSADRAQVVHDFITGADNPLVELVKEAVRLYGNGAELAVRHELPDVLECFSDVRPATLESLSQLHGLLPAASAFLTRSIENDNGLANTEIGGVPIGRRVALINDLVEKSSRNFMITKAWHESMDEKNDPGSPEGDTADAVDLPAAG